MFWEKNRQALLQAYPGHQSLVESLDSTPATTEVQLQETPNEDYTLLFQGIPLHAEAGAMQEAQAISRSQCRPALGRAHLILGIGLGYLLQAVYQRSPGQVIIYEPDLPLLKFVLENVDLTEFITSQRVFLASDTSSLLTLLNPLVAWEDPLDILITHGYARLMAEEIPALMNQLFALVDERIRDYKTGQHFHFQWIRQFFQNLHHLPQTIPLHSLTGAFTGKPALIIGRGPSLDAALEDIHAVANATLLIAVGGALRTLWQAGIIPDIAVFYDANGMQEQLHGLPDEYLSQIHFLISPFTEACCFTAPAKSRMIYFPQSGEALAQWFYEAVPKTNADSLGLLEGGGTVSLIALQAALEMGCNPVVLIGQDLAFPNQQVYAGGIPLTTDEQGRLALPKSDTLYTRPEAMTMVEGQTGESLPALSAYAAFIRHFERIAMAASNRETRFFNASLGGAKLNGYELTPLKPLLGIWPSWKTSELMETIHTAPTPTTDDLRQALGKLRSQVQKAIRLHEEALLAGADIQTINRQIYDLLNANPLISHCLMFEMMAAQKQYNPNATTVEEKMANQELLTRNTQQCRDILHHQLLPWLTEADSRLLKHQHPISSTRQPIETHSITDVK